MDESHKLDSQPVDEGPRPKEWQIEEKPTWQHIEGKSLGSDPKKELKMRAHYLETQDAN